MVSGGCYLVLCSSPAEHVGYDSTRLDSRSPRKEAVLYDLPLCLYVRAVDVVPDIVCAAVSYREFWNSFFGSRPLRELSNHIICSYPNLVILSVSTVHLFISHQFYVFVCHLLFIQHSHCTSFQIHRQSACVCRLCFRLCSWAYILDRPSTSGVWRWWKVITSSSQPAHASMLNPW